ncbi:hypothetical protein AB6809_29445 [Paraburkholderia sp. RCC_158]|uniref:hypothetical protein n=1 Tax=Paraburkholderia sp. RCC_158 TaxID=3239220 RepID=UPI0035263300
MCRIVFECLDQEGHLFTINVESENDVITQSIAAVVDAQRRVGIEVISASRIEEMPIDMDLHAVPAHRPAQVAQSSWRDLLPAVPAWASRLGTRVAAFGSLALSVVGFDGGFSPASIVHHLSRLMPVVGHVFHAIV